MLNKYLLSTLTMNIHKYLIVIELNCYCISVAKSCPTLCNPSFPVLHYLSDISQSFLKFMSIELLMPSNHPIFSCQVSLISINLEQITQIFFVFYDTNFFFSTLCAACKISVPDQVLNPSPLQWKLRVLSTGLPGNSQD